MAKTEKPRFDNLISVTSDAFNASAETQENYDPNTPKMVNHRQSVYRVPLSMVRPDRFQARLILPLALRKDFYSGIATWNEVVRNWFELARNDRLIAQEITELTVLGDSLHDTGQIKPVTGQVVSENGHDVFRMLTGERRFWATAIKAVLEDQVTEPYVLALIDNQPSIEKQIAENMAYKALTPVGKARAAARLVLESHQIQPGETESETAFFRRVTDVRLDDGTKDLLQKTLQLERTYFGRLMKFFELDEKDLEIADKSEMPERVLREIMQYDRALWSDAVAFYAAHEGRTYQDVHAFLERQSGHEVGRKARIPLDPTTKSARSLRRLLNGIEDLPADDKPGSIADALLGDVDREEARQLVARMETLTAALKQRLESLK
jgi:hypothetical protein